MPLPPQLSDSDHVILWKIAEGVLAGGGGGGGGAGVSSFNTRVGAVTLNSGDVTGALGFTPEPALGYVPENVANKNNDVTMAADSAVFYPTQHAAKTYSDTKLALTGGVLSGDLDISTGIHLDTDGSATFAVGAVSISAAGNVTIGGSLDMTAGLIVNVANPIAAQDAATKAYVDAATAGGPFQPLDSDLTAISALATTGFVVRTGAGTWTTRTLTGTANQVIITNGDGVAATAVFSTPQDIATTSTPQFARMGLGAPADATILLSGTVTNASAVSFSQSLTGANTQPIVSLTPTWNTSGTPTAVVLNLTDTASGLLSRLLDLQVGGASRFFVSKTGIATVTSTGSFTDSVTSFVLGAGILNLFTPAASASPLAIFQGAVTVDTPAATLAAIWNNVATTFTAVRLNVTDLASAAASLLLDLQVGGVSQFSVSKAGNVIIAGALNMTAGLINNVANPVAAQDAATKAYVDSATSGGPFLPLAGGTMVGTILFTDNSFDIGATGATRVRSIYAGTTINAQRNAIGATPADGVLLTNSTAAAAGAQQYSPAIRLTGQGWKTNATAGSQATDWRIYNQPVQGAANPSSNLLIQSSINGGAFSSIASLEPAIGLLTLTGTATGLSSFYSSYYAVLSNSAASFFAIDGHFRIYGSGNGVILLIDNSVASLNRVQFGGTTSAFPALGRDGIFLDVLAADGASTASLAVYNTKTSTTNFERLTCEWNSNVCRLWTEKGSGGGTARDLVLGRDAVEVSRYTSTGFQIATAKVLAIQSGSNQRAGNATMVGGTVTVANTTVTANTIVIVTRKTTGGTIGFAVTYTVTAATSFTLNSDNVLDTSTYSYLLIEVP